ncbi:hypothetical protein LWI28_019694 [Acer negundo]|uniref:Uncharacterized protein n=1 Tax=Acer negundo TaxID=4023 RepID=A0AAD5J163_ACENE|nr:hypothetical protein LWI28_019694 [Acer negundo]
MESEDIEKLCASLSLGDRDGPVQRATGPFRKVKHRNCTGATFPMIFSRNDWRLGKDNDWKRGKNDDDRNLGPVNEGDATKDIQASPILIMGDVGVGGNLQKENSPKTKMVVPISTRGNDEIPDTRWLLREVGGG